jgi:hypothetical protein
MGLIFVSEEFTNLTFPVNTDKCIGKVYLNELTGVYIELDKNLTERELNEIQYIEQRVEEARLKF